MDTTGIKLDNFVNKEIPPEILEQLQIVDRIQHFLKPTSTSAVSTSAEQPDDAGTIEDVNNEINRLIDDVAEFEDLVEQLEDLADEHLKDMNIPPADDRVANAVKVLDPNGKGNITKEVLDKANAILDYLPALSLGTDPVLAALVGDGRFDGPWFECNDFAADLADKLKKAVTGDYEPLDSINDVTTSQKEKHDKQLLAQMLETLCMLWWNMIWPKYFVDAGLINPLRLAIANPTDSLIGFFSKTGKPLEKGRFKKPDDAWLKTHGVINKLLVTLRIKLLCFPYKIYQRYKPMVEILDRDGNPVDCSAFVKCKTKKETTQFEKDNDKALDKMGDFMDDIGGGDYCFTEDDLAESVNTDLPEGPGSSPECAKAAMVVLEAVLADALTPPDRSKGDKQLYGNPEDVKIVDY